jgi:hypothetical protein
MSKQAVPRMAVPARLDIFPNANVLRVPDRPQDVVIHAACDATALSFEEP